MTTKPNKTVEDTTAEKLLARFPYWTDDDLGFALETLRSYGDARYNQAIEDAREKVPAMCDGERWHLEKNPADFFHRGWWACRTATLKALHALTGHKE